MTTLALKPHSDAETEQTGPRPVPGRRVSPRPGTPRLERPRHLHVVPSAAPTSSEVPLAARRAAGTAARGILEALAGMRPVAHLAQGCDLPTYELLRRRVRWETEQGHRRNDGPTATASAGPAGEHARLRMLSTHTQVVADGIEASTTFSLGDRVRALGFRLEAQRGRWRIVAMELG